MKTNTYTWRFEGLCPVNRRIDKYFATLEAEDTFIKVEDLLELCEKERDCPMYQEEWTQVIAVHFWEEKRKSGETGGSVKVTIVGHHKGGVRIESVYECKQ